METKGIVICGVGGQGSLLASKLLGRVLMNEGYDIKVSEVHGMSQRGGSVITYVRYGEKVYSPVIQTGEADYVISFERIEAARYASLLKKDGILITNTQRIDPMPVIIGAAEYPAEILDELREKNVQLEAFDALALANEAGSARAVNIVLMGQLAKHFHIDYDKWMAALEQVVKPQFVELNKKAFALGYEYTA
ncbi:MAG: indolepyruvate oxidoreductase subunit beta [Oscillospiraceae bacterium]|nr:indolepyruvate oxidoreductase subunit beta [Oscillospiraceae bacterium]MBQ8012706.1 indolepyruvate oxidoreductase subunit beta [Oscillospiraceae bacterium]MBQ9111189.1 indolepyruvate oxidoreductase subunit beta [Oscillospiraceae bacterium]